MNTSNYVKKINDYKKCMKVLECAHSVYIDEIDNFEFKKISKYNKSRNMYNKISTDFKVVNNLIEKEDLFNAATVLRTLYENIIYIIATSYDKKMIVTLDTTPKELRKILEDNCNIIFTDYFEKEDFNSIYKYLCKIVHPSSMKELVSYLVNTIKYKSYMINNLKYMMIVIEYMYLNYLNKKIKNEDNKFDLNFVDCCTYINLVNISYYIISIKNNTSSIKRFMYYDTKNKYVEENKKICEQLSVELKNNKNSIEKNIKELTRELDLQINESKYKELVSTILKSK